MKYDVEKHSVKFFAMKTCHNLIKYFQVTYLPSTYITSYLLFRNKKFPRKSKETGLTPNVVTERKTYDCGGFRKNQSKTHTKSKKLHHVLLNFLFQIYLPEKKKLDLVLSRCIKLHLN